MFLPIAPEYLGYGLFLSGTSMLRNCPAAASLLEPRCVPHSVEPDNEGTPATAPYRLASLDWSF